MFTRRIILRPEHLEIHATEDDWGRRESGDKPYFLGGCYRFSVGGEVETDLRMLDQGFIFPTSGNLPDSDTGLEVNIDLPILETEEELEEHGLPVLVYFLAAFESDARGKKWVTPEIRKTVERLVCSIDRRLVPLPKSTAALNVLRSIGEIQNDLSDDWICSQSFPVGERPDSGGVAGGGRDIIDRIKDRIRDRNRSDDGIDAHFLIIFALDGSLFDSVGGPLLADLAYSQSEGRLSLVSGTTTSVGLRFVQNRRTVLDDDGENIAEYDDNGLVVAEAGSDWSLQLALGPHADVRRRLVAPVNAALTHPNGRAYFFRGSEYQRYVFGENEGVDKTGRIGRDGW